MADTSVTICGNATNAPEQRYTQSGMAVASFGVAVSSRKKNASGEWEDGETSFFDVSCFGRLAENVSESVQKGKRVVVAGVLKQSSWESDGGRRTKVEIIADDVALSMKWDSYANDGGATPKVRAAAIANDDEPF